jgi:hypothetical protein
LAEKAWQTHQERKNGEEKELEAQEKGKTRGQRGKRHYEKLKKKPNLPAKQPKETI